MSFKFNPFTANFDMVDQGGSLYLSPVAMESDLTLLDPDGAVRVVLDTDRTYVYDAVTSKWYDSGLSSAAFSAVADAKGLSIVSTTTGDITQTQFVLHAADATHPGGVSVTTQQFAGAKEFLNPVTILEPTVASNPATKNYTDTTFIPLTQRGANNGVATLDAGGKIPASQLTNSVMEFQGAWDASTNTPTLSDGVGNPGDVYRTSVAGTQTFDGISHDYGIGDLIIYSGTVWQYSPATDVVISVNGQQGVVSLSTTDIPEGTRLYFTDERAQDAVGSILTDTATIDLIYDDAGNQITADVKDSSITDAKLTTGINANKIGSGAVTNTIFGYLDATSSIQTQFAGVQTQFSGVTTQLNTKVDKIAGDVLKTSFSASVTGTPSDVTGATFANGVVRSFNMTLDAVGASVYEYFTIRGVQRCSDWVISQSSFGDTSGIVFNITNAGQLQYISSTALTLSFKADVVGI